jgi:hypothetical protein
VDVYQFHTSVVESAMLVVVVGITTSDTERLIEEEERRSESECRFRSCDVGTEDRQDVLSSLRQ